jgi:penicillin-binding protein-related factor A (putative recombinase)
MKTTLRRRGADVGSGFQAAINSTNIVYAQAERAYITRKSIPGKYLARRGEQRRGMALNYLNEMPGEGGRFTSAELIALAGSAKQGQQQRDFVPESKAEPDYGGVIAPGGRAIFYDAKSTQRERLDIDNLHPHQIYFLEKMASAGAVSGFLVEFARYRKVYFLPIQVMQGYCSLTGHKSIPYKLFAEHLMPVSPGKGLLIFDYLNVIEQQEARYGTDYSNLKLASI